MGQWLKMSVPRLMAIVLRFAMEARTDQVLYSKQKKCKARLAAKLRLLQSHGGPSGEQLVDPLGFCNRSLGASRKFGWQ